MVFLTREIKMIIDTHFPMTEGVTFNVRANIVSGEIDELEITNFDNEPVDLRKIAIFPWASFKPVPAEDLVREHVMAAYRNA